MTIELRSKPVREKELEKLKSRCQALKDAGITPSMKVFLVGENPASQRYTRNKKKFCESFGAECEILQFAEDLDQASFLAQVKKVVADDSVHGCFIQLPLPAQLAALPVDQLIPAEKDVDGFNERNVQLLFHGDTGQQALLPCTPKGIITLLNHYGIGLSGKKVVIIGRSQIVGRPLALLMLNHHATVTVCHSKTTDIKALTREADIIVTAIGVPRFLDKDYIGGNKPVVIDVGINNDEQGKLAGDCHYQQIYDLCSAITPVPGGVGPMTILSLMENLLQAAENQKGTK
ncbi:MAG: bifunctional 5,10-methylenetetrahydrofolate dehydrogenase/5,10-methenyltetrahydrofolate cyclohydrolase [Halobacteriovoraceae bacterium]|nr:bifunctional 5,10-methylenetetrahydrofolate dehydrogenase/5,10-methenyltetrahydrofolate cyclohydrolase [Halobacteriovoraceae bacterium]